MSIDNSLPFSVWLYFAAMGGSTFWILFFVAMLAVEALNVLAYLLPMKCAS